MPQSAHFGGSAVPSLVLRRLVEVSDANILSSGRKQPEAVIMIRCVAWYRKVCLQMQSTELNHIYNDCCIADLLRSKAFKTASAKPACEGGRSSADITVSNGSFIYLEINLALLAEAC